MRPETIFRPTISITIKTNDKTRPRFMQHDDPPRNTRTHIQAPNGYRTHRHSPWSRAAAYRRQRLPALCARLHRRGGRLVDHREHAASTMNLYFNDRPKRE